MTLILVLFWKACPQIRSLIKMSQSVCVQVTNLVSTPDVRCCFAVWPLDDHAKLCSPLLFH